MYIYGKNVAKEKLNTNEPILKAYISKKFKDQTIIDDLKEKNIRINFVDNKVLDGKVDGLHQGIILEVEEAKTYTLEEFFNKIKNKANPLVVMLDHLEDPHNFGAIIRTCEALGIDGIIIPNDRSVGITGTVIKTSAGAISYTTIIRVPNLASTLEKLKKNGFWIVGTDMQGTDYTKLDYNMPICLVIGNEGKGMSKIIKNNCDFIATIPMSGQINSLNASVSCGIILSQIVSSRCP
ncbi:MAG: 23S rRNA (guanosine(2251)-2'-O)-methyltransferase RlmB [Bacilli bacterium]|nr:23S rRNA (guanosine(2251)-2'-O)-methyltransferase RlmB [Bacilli bacterium]